MMAILVVSPRNPERTKQMTTMTRNEMIAFLTTAGYTVSELSRMSTWQVAGIVRNVKENAMSSETVHAVLS